MEDVKVFMRLLPIEERKDKVCELCGTTKSVNYEHTGNHKVYCNMCILKVPNKGDNNGSRD